MKGYLDRIEDDKFAVILVDEINEEFVISKDELPEDSAKGSYFDLIIENGKITSLKLNDETTLSEQQKVDDLMSKVRSKSRASKFLKK